MTVSSLLQQHHGVAADTQLLAEVALFKFLDDEERRELAQQVEVVCLPAGMKVYAHGDPGDSIYIVRKGRVEVFHHTTDGGKIVLEIAEVGDFFGELSFLDNGSRSASVMVLEDLEALVIDRADLDRLIRKHPAAALDIFTAIGTRFRRLLERLQLSHARNSNDEIEDKRTRIERVADWIAEFSGSLAFLFIHVGIFAGWIGANLGFVPGVEPFDPYPFGLLTMVVSLEAIFLSVFVLLSQNRQVAKDRIRSDVEYEVNLRAEIEINELHLKLDRLSSEILTKIEGVHKELHRTSPKSAPKTFDA